jgi:hypothetical protein
MAGETTTNPSYPILVGSNDPFVDAEPYHYGSGTSTTDYFKPIKEDTNDTGTRIQPVLNEDKNGYSSIESIDGFRIDGEPLKYIEKGTFPFPKLIASHHSPYTAEDNKETDSAYSFCKLVVTYDNSDIKTITLQHYTVTPEEGKAEAVKYLDKLTGDGSGTCCDNEITISKNLSNFKDHGHEGKFPKRLGFILTGGGGGAGGVSRIDPKSDGKNNDVTTPGGGGGGAEIVCGVFDLTKPANTDNLEYIIYLGNGGKGGEHWQTNPDYDNPALGHAGTNGRDSIIWSSNKEEILHACGGFGGSGGTKSGGGTGGNGGSYPNNYLVGTTLNGCTICKKIKGGRGGNPSGESSMVNEALEFKIYFGKATPPSDSKFCLERKYDATTITHNKDSITKDPGTPGGHSFGNGTVSGATNNNNPVNGGGGCCKQSGGRDGAGGFFGIYY